MKLELSLVVLLAASSLRASAASLVARTAAPDVPALPSAVAPQLVSPQAAFATAAPAQAAPAPAVSAAAQVAAAAAPSAAPGAPQSAEAGAAQAEKVFDDADVRGQSVLLVGTRSSRSFILDETVRVSRALGLRLFLLDKPENRQHSKSVVPDSRFIPAPIDQRDLKTMRSIVVEIGRLAQQLKLDAVIAFRSHHAKLVGRLVDALKTVGVPKKAVLTADDKAQTRAVLNTIPGQEVPSREVRSAAEARRAFNEMGGGKFVMKTKHGENSRFIQFDLSSEEAVEKAYRKMDAELKAYAKLAESSDTIFNRHPGIVLERMLEMAPGTVEASVELVMQAGKAKLAVVSDTHGIGPKGEYAGGSMTFPSQQDPKVQSALIQSSIEAVNAVGIKDGNARVDIMMTPQGPRVIEINPYMGGAAIFRSVQLVTGESLVEYGIRALLKLKLKAAALNGTVVDYRFAASPVTGTLLSVDGLDEAKKMPGVQHLQQLIAVGDRLSAPTGNGFEEWLEIMGQGATLQEARENAVKALAKIKFKVRQDDGTIVDASADYLQPKP